LIVIVVPKKSKVVEIAKGLSLEGDFEQVVLNPAV